MKKVKYPIYQNDIPANIEWGSSVAVDTETLGLIPVRDRLCVVQLCGIGGDVAVVQMKRYDQSPNLCALLNDNSVEKLFHFARFDVAVLKHYLGVNIAPLYCTKVSSRIARCNTERHGLPDLCQFFLNEKLMKEQQKSDWGADVLTQEQVRYAASDVIHLHAIKDRINILLEREGRVDLAHKVCQFIATCAELDLMQTDYRYLIEH